MQALEGELGEVGVSPGSFGGWVPAFTTRFADAWCLVKKALEFFGSTVSSDGTGVMRGDEVCRNTWGRDVKRVGWVLVDREGARPIGVQPWACHVQMTLTEAKLLELERGGIRTWLAGEGVVPTGLRRNEQ